MDLHYKKGIKTMILNYKLTGNIKEAIENADLPTNDIYKRSVAVNDDGEVIIMDTCRNYTCASGLTAEKVYPLTKEQFVKALNDIKDFNEKIDRINNVLNETCDDNIYCPPSVENTLLNLLQELFDDKETDWIGYYIYELNYGEKWEPGIITDNGKDVKLETPEELYMLLIHNLDERESMDYEK